MTLRLGKRAPRVDPRTLHMASYLDLAQLPALPSASSWSHVVDNWGMLLNDVEGDCVIAGMLHEIELLSAANGREQSCTDDQAQAAYEAIGGYRPGDPSTDNGCVMLDAMNAWRRDGVAGNKLGAYVSIGHKDAGAITRIRASIALFGGCLFGLDLPQCIERQGHSWGVPKYGPRPGPRGDGTPGSLGGHCVLASGYRIDPDTRRYVFEFVSWGEVYTLSQSFAETYLDEAYCPLDSLWTDGTRPAPSGFDLAALTADLRAL